MPSRATRTGTFPSLSGGLLVAALLIPPGTLLADTVILRSGEVFSGRILRANAEEVSIQLESGGVLSFRANRVERIRQQRSGGSSDQVYNNAKTAESEGGQGKASGGKEEVTVSKAGGAEAGRIPPDLKSFPLHAQRSSPPPTPARKPEARPPSSSRRFQDTGNGYSLVAPSGFKSWSHPQLPAVVQGFMEPATQANVTVSIFDSGESLDRVKDGIVALLPRRSAAKVVRQSRREVPGIGGYQGWVLEMENAVGETTVRQLQLLAKSGGRIFIVTYSADSRNYSRFSRAFEASLDSFRFEQPRTVEKAVEPQADPLASAEVQSELRKSQSAPPRAPDSSQPSQIDPRAFRPDVEGTLEKVDKRMRVAPLRPYTITP